KHQRGLDGGETVIGLHEASQGFEHRQHDHSSNSYGSDWNTMVDRNSISPSALPASNGPMNGVIISYVYAARISTRSFDPPTSNPCGSIWPASSKTGPASPASAKESNVVASMRMSLQSTSATVKSHIASRKTLSGSPPACCSWPVRTMREAEL